MQVDVGTMYLAGALASVFIATVLYFGESLSSRRNGLAYVVLAMLALAVGLALLGMRGAVSDWLSQGIGNSLLAASALLFRFAVDELHNERGRSRIPWLVFGFVLLAEWSSFVAGTSEAVRAAVAAFGVAAVFLLPVPPLFRTQEPWLGKAHYVAGTAFLLGAVLSAARGFAIVADPANAQLTAPSLVNVLVAAAMLGIVAAGAVAFLVMLRQRELARLAMLDDLTEVFNRRAFIDQVERVLALAQRRGLSCSMALANLDQFSRINAKHGVRAGDDVLRHFTKLALGVVRREDVFGRYGGEEFGMLLFATPVSGAQALAGRLRTTLSSRPPQIGGAAIPFTVSVGVAEWRSGSKIDPAELLRRAAQALNDAKERGRDCVVCFEEPATQPG